ncbi:MAG: hypothetical protein ABI853_05675 [Sphingomicrobium sp.]
MRWMLLLALALAACSKGPEADLPSIGEARSLGAEWALVNEQAAKGHVTHVYADAMRKQLRKQLETNLASLKQPQSNYGEEIRALMALPDTVAPDAVRAHVETLKQIEDQLESA